MDASSVDQIIEANMQQQHKPAAKKLTHGRRQMLSTFMILQAEKLNRNKEKGDDWISLPYSRLLELLDAEVRELREAIEKGYDGLEIAYEAADIGNFAAMIAQKALYEKGNKE